MRQSLLKSTMSEATPLLRDSERQVSYVIVNIPDDAKPPKDVSSVDTITNTRVTKWKATMAVIQLVSLFVASVCVVYITLKLYLPPVDENQRDLLRLPKNFSDLQALNELLQSYMTEKYWNVLTSFTVVYLFLQTFSIPGSMWLSILGGALFGLPVAVLTVCTCCAIGSTFCYWISKKYGKSFVKKRYSEKLDRLSLHIQAHSHNLLNYIIVLRLAPFPPNWFANLAAPHIGIPLHIFIIGTFFGVAGPSIIHVQAGLTINSMTSPSDFHIFSLGNVGALVVIGLAVMVPVFFKKRVEQQTDQEESDGLLAAPVSTSSI